MRQMTDFWRGIVVARARFLHWLQMLVEFALAQGVGQVAGMLCGLIFVRLMPTDQYALYALCLTTLAMVSVGSDLGVTGYLSYFWRRNMQEGGDGIESKLAAVRLLRLGLFTLALVAGGLSLFTAASSTSFPLATTLVCFGFLACTAYVQLHASIDLLVMRLEGRQRITYYCDAVGNLTRLCVASSAIVGGVATAWFGLASGLLGTLLTYVVVRRNSRKIAVARINVTKSDWLDIRGYLFPLLPSVLVFMIQDPLVLWFTATRAGATTVAEVFALGRIGAIWAMLGTFAYLVLTPRLASIVDNARFLKMATLSFAALCILSATAVCVCWFYPQLPLSLLGHRYSHLQSELVIAAATSTAMVLASFLILAGRVRGWVKLDPIFGLGQLSIVILSCTYWNFDTTKHVLWLSFTIALSSLISAILIFSIGIFRPRLAGVSPLNP